jgi:hypothetical protein
MLEKPRKAEKTSTPDDFKAFMAESDEWVKANLKRVATITSSVRFISRDRSVNASLTLTFQQDLWQHLSPFNDISHEAIMPKMFAGRITACESGDHACAIGQR